MNPATEQSATNSGREGRSPNYPYVPLKEALARAKKLRGSIVKNDARLSTVGSVWGLGTKSSSLRSIIAALKQFGLIEYIGSGVERKIKLTDSAHRIILDERPESPDRDALVQKAALLPTAHSMLWQKWKDELPPDVEVIAELTIEQNFSKSGAAEFLTEYKDTLTFAKLLTGGNMPIQESDKVDVSTSQQTKTPPAQPPKLPAGISERISYKPGQDISVGFSTEPDVEMYEFLRDYLEFRIQRMKKQSQSE
jgi:hypothetical protein